MFWNAEMECLPIEELRALQYSRLRDLVTRLYDSNEFYRQKMETANVTPDDIRSMEDISKLPFMYKQEFRDNYPTKMFNVPNTEIVRYHVSSGTTGKPTLVGYTRSDLDYWTEALARSLTSIGIGDDDTLQVSYGYGLFTGGLGLHYGAERVGASVLPASTGSTERQLELMQDLDVTVIACTPSYFVHMMETAERLGIDFRKDTKLKKAVMGAEQWTEGMRERIEESTGVEAYDIYGTSELAGPMFTECEKRDGIHICSDIAYVEIIDPATGEVLPSGEKGELVITMLTKDAFPLVRYRIGDITSIEEEKCGCGRSSPRIARITGRSDDMLIVRGINVFPSQVEYALMQVPEVGNQYMIIMTREGALDNMTVQVEIKPESFSDKMEDMLTLRSHIEMELKKYLNVGVHVELKAPGELPRFDGKASRVKDMRSL